MQRKGTGVIKMKYITIVSRTYNNTCNLCHGSGRGRKAYNEDLELRIKLLTEERDKLRAELEQMRDDAMMACECPPTNCDCAGCSYARERAKEAP